MESPSSPPTLGRSFPGPQIRQGSDLGSPKFDHCFRWPLSAASRPAHNSGIGLVTSPTVSQRQHRFWKSVCAPNTHWTLRGGQDVGSVAPVSRKTTGHCPQFPPNLGIVPGSSNGLGVAPVHWGLPLGSRSPSAASTSAAPTSSALPPFSSDPPAPADPTFGLVVSSPWRAPSCPSSSTAGHRLPRSLSSGLLRSSAGAGCWLLPRRQRSFGLGAPKRAPLCVHSANNAVVGKAPGRPGSGKGRALGRLGASNPTGRGLGEASVERGRGD
jgi:hypothetical protein